MPKSAPPTPNETPPHRTIRVLCVDDNRDLANTIAMLLDFGGFDARICYDGYDAVVEAIHFKPHVCLIDIQMPGRSGLEVARQIRSHFGEQTPQLIAVTALRDDEYRQYIRDAGFHQHLIKPVAPDDLLRAIVTNTTNTSFPLTSLGKPGIQADDARLASTIKKDESH